MSRLGPTSQRMTSIIALSGLCLFAAIGYLSAEKISSLSLIPTSGMTRADLHYLKVTPQPSAVLVLCPGYNGNGAGLLHQPIWQDFARQHNLGLIGIHFESPIDLLSQCQGYYQASKGSGKLLLSGIREAFGRDLPILIYGFSGGAHFTTRFIAWRPDRITGWVALGAGVLDPPHSSACNPPGIMACGENDPRLGGALTFFKQGRAEGKPWLWVELPETGHTMSSRFDRFVRAYFASLLQPHDSPDAWVDIDLMKVIPPEDAQRQPSLSGWLPDRRLYEIWKESGES